MKPVYNKYEERLVEISGKSRSIFSNKGNNKYSCDLGEFFGCDEVVFEAFINNLWKGNSEPFDLLNEDIIKKLYKQSKIDAELKKDSKYLNLLENNADDAKKYLNRLRNKAVKKLVDDTVKKFSQLKKEILDVAKETGKYELYVGYPFVYGNISGESVVKAPLVLFPVRINVIGDSTVSLELIKDMPVTLNKPLLFSYAIDKKLNIDDVNMEFSGNFSKHFKNIEDILGYLKKNHIKISLYNDKNICTFDSSGIPTKESVLRVKKHCVVGRYSLANAIYVDYNSLGKMKDSTNGAINEVLFAKEVKKNKRKNNKNSKELYTISKLDYTQEKAIESINNEGNIVIYGPPGTGKSQTIVNIITDALAKKKKVLVVSQKKASLDVVYNRLGKVKRKAMFILDPIKDKEIFYKRTYSAHLNTQSLDCSDFYNKHRQLENKIMENYNELDEIFKVLYEPCEFGVSLEKMYEQSSQIAKNTYDYQIYKAMIESDELLDIKYDELVKCLENINLNNRRDLYFDYLELLNKNSIVEHLKKDLKVDTVDRVLNEMDRTLNNVSIGYDCTRYPYCSYLVAHYINNFDNEEIDLDSLVSMVIKLNKKKGVLTYKNEKELKKIFTKALKEIKNETEKFSFLKEVLTPRGYQLMMGAVLNGNSFMFRNLKSGLNNYISLRDVRLELDKLNDNELKILNFAYNLGNTELKYNQIIDNFMPIRMYIEIVEQEEKRKDDLAKIMNFNSIKNNIVTLKKKQNELASEIALNSFNDIYLQNFSKNKENKNFLYQISKQQNAWPLRRFMKEYKDLMLDLYPCWLLSPENVSTIMPLVKDMFDIVLFDEASQVFVENTIPTMYRGKNVVIAGDSKQLRPTSTFMKRYMGSDVDEDVDPELEAALEVESLLDLATSRVPGTYLNYHYRSRYEELVDFNNKYFYDDKLEIVPNLVGSDKNNAITRVKVDGKWFDRKNEIEAKKVVDILKQALAKRVNNESIGIITFNSEQSYAIEEEIRKECKKDQAFADAIIKERNRFENNEDISLFVKNLENVQGDERDIIILSVGYAYNENGRIVTNFGSLSTDGGENRLNVAVTRAKERIFVVTSIEPEDLKVEKAKNEGPKILKKYLSYVRAVSNHNKEEVKIWLNNKKENTNKQITSKDQIANEIKEELEKLGYKVDVKIGNTKRKIDLAVYDEESGRYLLGVECINKEYKNKEEMIENQIYHVDFLQSRGWKIHHVWTRDWWLNKNKVINTIIKEIESSKKGSGLKATNGAKKRK